MLGAVTLNEELDRISAIAARHAGADEHLAAVLVAEPTPGERLFLCAFVGAAGRTWLALDARGASIDARDRIREAVSIAAVCELAEESAGIAERTTPRVASPEYLDELGGSATTEIAVAVQQGLGAVEELVREVEAAYKLPLV
jgi:hypothetical protein